MAHKNFYYKITCTITGKVYIGSSITPHRRITQHKCDLKKGTHKNKDLQSDYLKYGVLAFTYEVIDSNNDSNITIREIELINQYDELSGVYNIYIDKSETLITRIDTDVYQSLKEKAKRYKLTLSEVMRRKLNDDNDKHLFI